MNISIDYNPEDCDKVTLGAMRVLIPDLPNIIPPPTISCTKTVKCEGALSHEGVTINLFFSISFGTMGVTNTILLTSELVYYFKINIHIHNDNTYHTYL